MQRHLAVAFFVLFAAVVMVSCSGVTTTGSGYPLIDEKQDMVDRANKTRRSAGLPALTVDLKLNSIAQAQAEYMAAIEKLVLVDGYGDGIRERATNAGYDWNSIGQNVARDYTASRCYEEWMDSTDSHANIVHSQVTEIGVGVAYVGSMEYWCMVLGDE